MTYIRRKKIGTERPGTGDVFSSVVAGVCVRGGSLTEGVALAARLCKGLYPPFRGTSDPC